MTQVEPNWLHVYPAALWHDDVALVGTAQALRHLAERLIEAADRGAAVASCCVTDGEGYWLTIVREDSLRTREDIPLHYLDALAGGPVTPLALPEDIQKRMDAAQRKRHDG